MHASPATPSFDRSNNSPAGIPCQGRGLLTLSDVSHVISNATGLRVGYARVYELLITRGPLHRPDGSPIRPLRRRIGRRRRTGRTRRLRPVATWTVDVTDIPHIANRLGVTITLEEVVEHIAGVATLEGRHTDEISRPVVPASDVAVDAASQR